MLPGLRFLFAAVVLSISLLVFGLGAAALLRAAHQEFASLPSRPAPPEPVFAPQASDTIPSLAMLRIDVPTADEEAAELPAAGNIQAAAPPESSSAIAAAPPQPPQLKPDRMVVPMAVLPEPQEPAEVTPSETPARNAPPAAAQPPQTAALAPPEVLASPTVQSPTAPERQPAVQAPPAAQASEAEAPSPTGTKIATVEIATVETTTPPSKNQDAPTDPEPSSAVTPTPDAVSTKVATLGGPPIDIEAETSPVKARSKPGTAGVKKRLRSKRVIQRHKLARRARAVRRALQVPADPFGTQPFGGFPGVPSRVR